MSPSPSPDPAAGPAADGPQSTVDALVQLSFLIQGVLARVAADHDLSLIQVRLLGILRDRQPGMLELARYLGLDKSSTTGLVSRAEKRGLVQRLPSPHDGRAVLVSLTPLGRQLVDRGAAQTERQIASLTASLSAAEHSQLRSLTARLQQAALSGDAAR